MPKVAAGGDLLCAAFNPDYRYLPGLPGASDLLNLVGQVLG